MILWLLACGAPPAPAPPAGHGVGSGGGDVDPEDTAACGTCTLIDCADGSDPGAHTEDDCASAADDQECAEWEWEVC